MTYKETLFFVGQCLTINHEEKNRNAIEAQLISGVINWEAVVKLSTSHFVFPALYLNLQRADFLHYLPEDLVSYMGHITDLNRERNNQIMAQAKELNALLLDKGITPIFLKGTGNLLEGLYADIGERMVGDIDFIVPRGRYSASIEILKNFGYEPVIKDTYQYPIFKHAPRLHKIDGNHIAAVEIHKEMIIEKYAFEFNYEYIKSDIQCVNGFHVLSYSNQLNLSIIASQINDDGYAFNTIFLRNAYDVFLLSKKASAQNAISNLNALFDSLNCFLSICYEVMGQLSSLNYKDTDKTKTYLKAFYTLLNDDILRVKSAKRISRKLFVKERLEFILKSFSNKEYRNWIINRAMDKNWQKQKLIQLGLKKRTN